MIVWKAVKLYEGFYEVSNQGNVRNVKSRKTLRHATDRYGYFFVCLCKNGKKKCIRIHRLVAIAFIPNPLSLETVDHIDNNPKNNHHKNLQWMTRKENTRKSLLGKVGSSNNAAKLSEDQAVELLTLRNNGWTYKALSARYKIGKSTVGNIVRGTTWKHLNRRLLE